MLRACGRVLKPGGMMSFLVIAVADGLSAEETDRVLNVGPEHIATGVGYPSLLRAAGFEGVDVVDVTDEYLVTQAAWIREWDDESLVLERLLGANEFAERQLRRRRALATVEAGLMRRHWISAVRS